MISSVILSVCSILGAISIYFLTKACKDRQIIILKQQRYLSDVILQGLAVLLFCLFFPHVWCREVISTQIGLDGSLFSAFGYSALSVLEWLTTLAVAFSIISPFFQKQEAKDFRTFLSIPIILANIIFIEPICVAILGEADMGSWRIILYQAIVVVLAMICGSSFIKAVVEKDFGGLLKRLGKSALSTVLYAVAFMPMYFLQLNFGKFGAIPKDFVLEHRLIIYASFIIPLLIYFTQVKKSYDDRYFLVMMLALGGVIQFFSYQSFRNSAQVFPLHLCNTAIILMFFAYMFKIKGLYYFTYFINVLGALCAILLPDLYVEFSTMTNLDFWYNHLYAFFLPLLGVALGIFEKPTLKLISTSLIVFTVYVLVAMGFNTYLNGTQFGGYDGGTYRANYFFLYNDFFIDKFAFAIPLKYDFIFRFTINGSTMEMYPVYDLAIYVVFMALIFVMWGFYSLVFNICESHRTLATRKKLRRVDKLNLLKELNGRPITAPLNPQGENMIKITNFSKTYDGSNKKAVDGLSLEIKKGEVFGFIGHNGAGKSTTIKSLVGIQSITEGTIEIDGYDISRQPLEAKLRMGYVSDNHALYEKLTGREYINYVADLYMVSEEDKKARIDKYVKMFQLEHAIDNEIKSYSHGMKQKTMVIAALIHNPKVWVLDEPLTGLDPTSAYQIKQCMREHADNGNIVFFSSHVIEVVERICDRIAIISGGKLQRVCTIADIKKEGLSLEQLYLQYAKKPTQIDEQNTEILNQAESVVRN